MPFTGVPREKPQGVGLFSRLASADKTEKKPHPWRFFEKPLYSSNNNKIVHGGGAFFWLASSEKAEKKPHPPGAFREEPIPGGKGQCVACKNTKDIALIN